jgi:hypothetical protein
LQFDAGLAAALDVQSIVQAYGLKDRAQLVVAIGSTCQYVKTQIDLGKSWDSDRGHSAG